MIQVVRLFTLFFVKAECEHGSETTCSDLTGCRWDAEDLECVTLFLVQSFCLICHARKSDMTAGNFRFFVSEGLCCTTLVFRLHDWKKRFLQERCGHEKKAKFFFKMQL